MTDSVQIFSEGSFLKGTLTWGWQCFSCREEETGFGSATTAGEGRDQHASLGCCQHEWSDTHECLICGTERSG